jgi:2-aminoadipate transaminase
MHQLGGGLPADDLLPRRALETAFARAMRSSSNAALQYGWPEGTPALRDWIAARLRMRGAAIGRDDVVVTAGAQQAIAIPTRARARRGGRVTVDEETYPAALDLCRSVGLAPTTSLAGTAFAYAMPAVANPRGGGASPSRRAELLGSNVPIVEDDAYAELRFDGAIAPALLAEARDRVWHVGTFSKTLCLGLRVGWLVPPPDARDEAIAIKQTDDLQTASLAQALLVELLAEMDYDAHLSHARRFYEARANALTSALRRTRPEWRFREPDGGFSVFVETDTVGDDAAFLALAAARGVSFDPGRLFRATGAASPVALRLCYSVAGEEDLRNAVERLASAWHAFSPAPRRCA